MMDYVKIQSRFDRLEEISEKALEFEGYSLMGGVESSVEYPKGYKDSTDGFVTIQVSNTFVFSGKVLDDLLKLLEPRKSKAKSGYDVAVELTVEHTSQCTKLIFRVPDIWIWKDRPGVAESEAAELSGLSVDELRKLTGH